VNRRIGRVHDYGNTKITESYVATQVLEDVRGFDVSMQQASRMAKRKASEGPANCLDGRVRLETRSNGLIQGSTRERGVQVWNVAKQISVVDFESVVAREQGQDCGLLPGTSPVLAEEQL
jgi:hypothetical protein